MKSVKTKQKFAKSRNVWNNQSMKQTSITQIIATNGVIGALYIVLTLVLAPISFGPIQFRVAECLTILPIFYPFAFIGLTIGCLISNALGGAILADILLGSLATLVSALLTAKIKKIPWAMFPPIIINAFVVPLSWFIFSTDAAYWINVLTVGAGQAAIIFGLGIPLFFVFRKYLKNTAFENDANKSE